MGTDKYIGLLTSYHQGKPKLEASLTVAMAGIVANSNALLSMHALYDLDTAVGDQLKTIARWVGAPLAIPDAVPYELFGFDGQSNALTFGETGDPSIGGFWRESGMGSGSALPLPDSRLRQVIKAQIYRNRCDGTIGDAYTILNMVTSVTFFIFDSMQMWIGIGLSAGPDLVEVELMRVMYPRPAGVGLKFFSGWIDGFGWADQPNSLGFGDTSDADIGGFWVEELM